MTFKTILSRLFTVPYRPDPTLSTFVERAQTQEDSRAQVTVAVLDALESTRLFGVHLARRGIQAVHLRIVNRSSAPLRLQLVQIDPNYYTPLEAAGVCHFSIGRRLSAFGILAFLFLPFLLIIPFKLITAYRANSRMDALFRKLGFRLHPIPPGSSSEGFVFTPIDVGTKIVNIVLHQANDLARAAGLIEADEESEGAANYHFAVAVPGIAVDYLRRDFAAMQLAGPIEECDLQKLSERLSAMPSATSNGRGTRSGDPVNLVVVGEFETLLSAFAARWDESETITLATCWKTFRAFLLGSQYRYSPVSPLYLFNRSQDVALQRTRRSINERLHLRLWLTGLRFRERPVWIGQVSRDIGVRFTTKTWNLTTHRVDPDVDEARDYVIEDLLQAERIEAAAYVGGVGATADNVFRHNLTGDPYFTDGKRCAILLSTVRTKPRFMAWS
jgi:hypothetical protein